VALQGAVGLFWNLERRSKDGETAMTQYIEPVEYSKYAFKGDLFEANPAPSSVGDTPCREPHKLAFRQPGSIRHAADDNPSNDPARSSIALR